MVKKQILTINVGQAGIQMSHAIWEQFCAEHGIMADGDLINTDVKKDNSGDLSYETFFMVSSRDKYVPRTLFLDLEPNVIAEISTGSYRKLFHPNQLIYGPEDACNNYARGFHTAGRIIRHRYINQLRREFENCEYLDGIVFTRSLGGGTGSGLTSIVMDDLKDFGKKMKIELPVHPAPGLNSGIVEPYNCILSENHVIENLDMGLLMDNEALFDILFDSLDVRQPTFHNINKIIAQVFSSITCSTRYNSVNFSDIILMPTNLIPYPHIHFPITSFSPLCSEEKMEKDSNNVSNLTRDVFDSRNNLVKVDSAKYGYYMSCSIIYRGLINNYHIYSSLAELKASKINFVDWCPTGFKIGIVEQPPLKTPGSFLCDTDRNVVMLSNSSIVSYVWHGMAEKFHRLFYKKAFVHWYEVEGVEVPEFTESLKKIATLAKDYEMLSHNEGNNELGGEGEEGEDGNTETSKLARLSSSDKNNGGRLNTRNNQNNKGTKNRGNMNMNNYEGEDENEDEYECADEYSRNGVVDFDADDGEDEDNDNERRAGIGKKKSAYSRTGDSGHAVYTPHSNNNSGYPKNSRKNLSCNRTAAQHKNTKNDAENFPSDFVTSSENESDDANNNHNDDAAAAATNDRVRRRRRGEKQQHRYSDDDDDDADDDVVSKVQSDSMSMTSSSSRFSDSSKPATMLGGDGRPMHDRRRAQPSQQHHGDNNSMSGRERGKNAIGGSAASVAAGAAATADDEFDGNREDIQYQSDEMNSIVNSLLHRLQQNNALDSQTLNAVMGGTAAAGNVGVRQAFVGGAASHSALLNSRPRVSDHQELPTTASGEGPAPILPQQQQQQIAARRDGRWSGGGDDDVRNMTMQHSQQHSQQHQTSQSSASTVITTPSIHSNGVSAAGFIELNEGGEAGLSGSGTAPPPTFYPSTQWQQQQQQHHHHHQQQRQKNASTLHNNTSTLSLNSHLQSYTQPQQSAQPQPPQRQQHTSLSASASRGATSLRTEQEAPPTALQNAVFGDRLRQSMHSLFHNSTSRSEEDTYLAGPTSTMNNNLRGGSQLPPSRMTNAAGSAAATTNSLLMRSQRSDMFDEESLESRLMRPGVASATSPPAGAWPWSGATRARPGSSFEQQEMERKRKARSKSTYLCIVEP